MGNFCACCAWKSHDKPMGETNVINYGSAVPNHVGHVGKSQSGCHSECAKDGLSGYRSLSNDPSHLNNSYPYHRSDSRISRAGHNGPASLGDMQGVRDFSYRTQGDFGMSVEPSDFMLSSVYTQSSTSNLQHISEREPDDTEADPSLNPTKRTLFMQRSSKDIERKLREIRTKYDRNVPRTRQNTIPVLYRSSSTSTIWLHDSTVTRPDPKSTVRALAQAIYLQIKHRNHKIACDPMIEIFDESLHPIQNEPVPFDYATRDPDLKTVYRFIRNLFQMAQLSPECAIVTMVYLERLLTSAETELTPSSWKRIVLCAIVLASKVWDDQAVWNVDYCQILKDMQVDDVNELERRFLEIIQFNINVPSSVYAKYYFDIRSLCGPSYQPTLLSTDRAYKLEAFSRVMDDQFHDLVQKCLTKKKWGSLDSLTSSPSFRRAIIS
ncbi:unnamed protein product [Schistosoma bovis]|nr:unnamed protein product [Schistosoma bovis]CAH8441090.1 unnamed protein product [Schistosoma bovis]